MSNNTSEFNIDLNELILALSRTLGLICGEMVNHGKRVTCLAMTLAEPLRLPPSNLNDLLFASLLHDAGICSADEFENLAQADSEQSEKHCLEGARLFKGFPPLSGTAEIIRHHHTRWTDLTDSGVAREVATAANLVFLADRCDIILIQNQHPPAGWELTKNMARDRSGSYFNPALVDIFLEKSRDDNFWLKLRPENIDETFNRLFRPQPFILNLNDLEKAAAIFGRIVDRKSPYTACHSEGVSRICVLIATELGLDRKTVQGLRIAGQVHDLGKLAVPNEILDKTERLSKAEFEIIEQHPLITHEILEGISGLEDIRTWASYHHERPDGSGYPFHVTSEKMNVGHLVVIVSEIVQALIQDRPYRVGLPEKQVLDILDHLTGQFRDLEPLVAIVHREFDLVRHLAVGLDGNEPLQPNINQPSGLAEA